jgi:hypothetical protein
MKKKEKLGNGRMECLKNKTNGKIEKQGNGEMGKSHIIPVLISSTTALQAVVWPKYYLY